MTLSWLDEPMAAVSLEWAGRAWERQNRLTKPSGSLGRLEEIAVRLAGLQRRPLPTMDRVRIVVFAGDHGVAADGAVSAFPQAVTVEMIRNFSRGGAAICVLARHLGAALEVVDVGALTDSAPLPGVVSRRIGDGTRDFRREAAMTGAQLAAALTAGREAVDRALAAGADLLVGGEMGIGNTTAATAMIAALLQLAPKRLAGPGTGLDPEGVTQKARTIAAALEHHHVDPAQPLRVLATFGGFEIAALTGAFLASGQRGLPVMVDGFIATAAALAAVRLRKDLAPWLLYAHRSAEPGHRAALAALEAEPLLDLGMRLGEGSGAAVAVPLLRMACALHREMATFAEAGVSEG